MEDTSPPLAGQPRLLWTDVQGFLDKPIAFHRILATIAGSANGGLFLSQSLYWSRHTRDAEGWFYKTQDEWHQETALTRYEQESVRKSLRSKGFLEERRSGLPARLYFRIAKDAVRSALERELATQAADSQESGKPPNKNVASRSAKDGENQQTSPGKSPQPVSGKPAGRSAGKPQTIQSEITTAVNTTASNTTTTRGVPPVVVALSASLQQNGVSPAVADDLAARYPEATAEQLQYIDYRKAEDRAAVLVKSIKNGYAQPAAFAKAQAEAEAEANVQRDRARATERRRAEKAAAQAQRDREQDENDRIDAFYKSLPADERAQIEQQARDQLQRLGAVGMAGAGALAATIRNIIRKEQGLMPEEEADGD